MDSSEIPVASARGSLKFQVINYQETKPATLTGIEKYLGSGLIKGVGPVTAKRIVAHFGLETLDIIENQIERLVEVQGIAKKRITLIKNAWSTQKAIKEVMVFLLSSWRFYHLCCEDFMNLSQTAVTNAVNLAFFMVNLSHHLLSDFRQHNPDSGIIDLKAYYRGFRYVREILKMLPEMPEPILLTQIFAKLTSLGRIHPVSTGVEPS